MIKLPNNKFAMPGEPAPGGFYVANLTDEQGRLRALIVAPKAQGETKEIWQTEYTLIEGAQSPIDGKANTDAMATAGLPLALWAHGLVIDGQDDYYIPASCELEAIHRAFKPTTTENCCSWRDGENIAAPDMANRLPYTPKHPAETTVAAFQEGGPEQLDVTWYWASTQYSAILAWVQYCGHGLQNISLKDNKLAARAVRSILVIE